MEGNVKRSVSEVYSEVSIGLPQRLDPIIIRDDKSVQEDGEENGGYQQGNQ